MPSACIFCDIAAGNADAEVIYSDDVSMAFLDKRPLFPGHVLVIPTPHVGTLVELPESQVEPLFRRVRVMAAVVQGACEAEGTFVAMNNTVSQSVPHLHIHVVPRRKKDGLKGFFWPRNPYESPEAMAEMGQKLSQVWADTWEEA